MASFAQRSGASRQTSAQSAGTTGRAPAGSGSTVSSLLDLQHMAGNHAVGRLLQEESGDVYERDADRVAEQVMRAPERQRPMPGTAGESAAASRTEHSDGRHRNRPLGSVQDGDGGRFEVPPVVHDVLSSPGQPLDAATRAFMEPRFGYDLSAVRVHVDAAAQRSAQHLGARAYATGRDIVFGGGRFDPGTHAGRTLLAHELAHVVQQTGGGASGAHDPAVASSGARIARQKDPAAGSPPNAGKMLTDWLLPKPVQPPAPKAPVTRTSDRVRRTRVTLTVTGHASPRWKSARSNPQADARNLALSHEREDATRQRVEQLLREALPDQQLIFEYAQSRTADPDPLDLSATVDVDSSAVGSRATLQEAGKAGRTANDPSMRRVDLGIDLSSAIDTVQDTTVHEKRRVSGATRNWAIKMGMTMQVEEGVGGGTFNFMLKNRKSGQEVEGWAEYGLGGVGASVPIPTIDTGGYENFTTKQEVNFSDFDYKRFTIGGGGFNALLFGYEWSSMSILGLPGGDVTGIDIGGFVMGGAGIDLGSGKFGMIWLRSTPDTYLADVERTERKSYASRMAEQNRHRVLFETGDASISADQDDSLRAFVEAAVEHYQRGGVYTP